MGQFCAPAAVEQDCRLNLGQHASGLSLLQLNCEKMKDTPQSGPSIVREACVDDAAVIAKVHVASWQSAYRGIMPDSLLDQLSVAEWTKRWETILQPSARLTLVLENDGQIRGWASMGPCRDEDKEPCSGELYGIYLDPAFGSSGLGTILYRRVEELMRESGFTESRLWVLEANERGRRFYKKVGYAQDGHTKCIQREGAELVELRYKKNLRSSIV